MKSKKILDSIYYRFAPAEKKIYFSHNLALKQQDILLIVNMNGNQMIYNFACSDEGGILENSVLRLAYDTSLSMNDTDQLMVIVSSEDQVELYLKKILDKLSDIAEVYMESNESKNI